MENRIITAAILTKIRQFFVSAVVLKLFFHRKQPAAKIRIEHMRYRIEVPFSGDTSVMTKYAAAREVLKRYVYFSFLIAMVENLDCQFGSSFAGFLCSDKTDKRKNQINDNVQILEEAFCVFSCVLNKKCNSNN